MPTGETDLEQLIRGMRPVLANDTFVFTTFKNDEDLSQFNPLMSFKEQEGTTLILTRFVAENANVDYEFPCKMITLNIHSALDAVGFLARISSRLAALGIGVNPVAGFYHDHLFIPSDMAEAAMKELTAMIDEAAR